MVLLTAVRVVPFAVLIRMNCAYEFLETTAPPDWLAYACSSNLVPFYLCSAHPLWGTELFIAHLAEGLERRGIEVVAAIVCPADWY
jgi:hypothetical protein